MAFVIQANVTFGLRVGFSIQDQDIDGFFYPSQISVDPKSREEPKVSSSK